MQGNSNWATSNQSSKSLSGMWEEQLQFGESQKIEEQKIELQKQEVQLKQQQQDTQQLFVTGGLAIGGAVVLMVAVYLIVNTLKAKRKKL